VLSTYRCATAAANDVTMITMMNPAARMMGLIDLSIRMTTEKVSSAAKVVNMIWEKAERKFIGATPW
jgi:hypothetical protein